MKKKYFLLLFIIFTILFLFGSFWAFCNKSYTNEDFDIEDIKSDIDYDNDGIDDYTDIHNGALNYVKTKPKYKSKYYGDGYPTDKYGVCTDVIWNAFMEAGYNLKDMVDEDIKNNMEVYNIEMADPNIDFRRVVNLKVFFDRKATILTNDTSKIEEFQKGDIIVFEKHIAIISEKRNKKGIPYIIHNSGNHRYVEDALTRYKIVGHYRWN